VVRWYWGLGGSLKGRKVRASGRWSLFKTGPVQLFFTSASLHLHKHCSDCGAFDAVMGYLQESKKAVMKICQKRQRNRGF